MSTAESLSLSALFERDETAWMKLTALRIRQGQLDEVDYPELAEFLADMARRDRREVKSRLAVLMTHILKWLHQSQRRSGNWRGTIVAQRQELAGLVSRGVLRHHAEAVLSDVHHQAAERAAAKTSLNVSVFPAECPYSLDELLSVGVLAS